MITLMIIPAFKGSKRDLLTCLLWTLTIDAVIVLTHFNL